MHPYQSAPAQAFWSKAVSRDFDQRSLIDSRKPLVVAGDRVASAGSCFASNLVPYLEQAGLTYLRTEVRPAALADIPAENLGYDKFSAAYGNIYTPRQLLQLLRRTNGSFRPREDRWRTSAGVLDPFRPGLRYHALSDVEFDLLSVQHLGAVRRVFLESSVFIFTLGLTEAWISKPDGAVFPACPGAVAGSFNPNLHEFVNFSAAQISSDLSLFVEELRVVNPGVRIILTVSPVPLVATASGQHVLLSSTYSKAVLRVAAEEVASRYPLVRYFPAYEIVTGPQAPDSYFEEDRRNVSKLAIDSVMAAFLAACELPAQSDEGREALKGISTAQPPDSHQRLSEAIADADCEEAMIDRFAEPQSNQRGA